MNSPNLLTLAQSSTPNLPPMVQGFEILLLSLVYLGTVCAFNNRVARTPPMGWNSWNFFQGKIDEKIVKSIGMAKRRYAVVDTRLRRQEIVEPTGVQSANQPTGSQQTGVQSPNQPIGSQISTESHQDADPYQPVERQDDTDLEQDAELEHDGTFEEPEPKRTKGPTLMSHIWELEDGMKVLVTLGVAGLPVGKEASTFTSYIGSIVRRSYMAPINYLDWRLMPGELKNSIWATIESKVEFQPKCTVQTKKWIMANAATKWRGWKGEMKDKVYDNYLTAEQMWDKLQKVPRFKGRADKSQFIELANAWLSSEHQALCAQNSTNRLKHQEPHCTGSKTFACIIHEKQLAEGRTPSRVDIYTISRTTTKGEPVNLKAKEIMDLMKQQEKDDEVGSSSFVGVVAWLGDSYSKVKGLEKRGRVRCLGSIPPKSSQGSTCDQNSVQEKVDGLLDIVTNMAENWKNPNANMDGMLQAARQLASQVPYVNPPA